MKRYLIKHQSQLFLTKEQLWADSSQPAQLFSTSHYDDALNRMVELTVSDMNLRLCVVTAEIGAQGKLVIPGDGDKEFANSDQPACVFQLEHEEPEVNSL